VAYPEFFVAPMREELTRLGMEELRTPAQVDEALSRKGTTLLVVNSICGCAAGHARPGAMRALQNARIPDRSVTVFAGVDRDAVNRAREFMAGYPPSSPSMALFKDGKQVLMLQRSDIQQMTDDQVAEALSQAFDEHCTRQGPSVDPETYRKVQPYQGCGSQIPVVGRS
jgi:putative YphP/YqiW family bacilliredoxin